MSRVRILHVTFDMAIAGTEQVIRQLVENTDPKQYQASIMCIDGKVGELGQELVKKGFKIDALKRSVSGLDFKLIKALKAYIQKHKIDILHCHQYTPYVYGLFASVGTGVPVIFTEHGRFYPDSYKWKRLALNPILSLFTAQITAISKATADALVKYENFPRRKIRVIYNGIKCDPDAIGNEVGEKLRAELGIGKDAKILGTISRLDPIKNQTMMIEAFSQVLKQHPNTYLLIVGDGSERAKLEQLTQQLNIEPRVIFTGFKVNPQRYFKLLDVFLLSSLSEGTSMTLLEAMAFSKPSVVTGVGGNPEIVEHGVTGLVTPSDDAESFSEAIVELLNNRPLSIKLGQRGQALYLNKFSVAQMIMLFTELYASTLLRNRFRINI